MSRISPADCVAVESNGISYIFYVNNKGFISSLKGTAGGVETEEAGFYKKENVNLTAKDDDGNDVSGAVKTSPDLKQVAAVAYKDNNGQYQIRLYYAEEKAAKLKEICRTNNGPWTKGALGRTTEFKLLANSSISANVAGGQLKVFACRDDDINEDMNAELNCFFRDINSNNWQPRRVTQDIKY